ncbi:MAG: hypothetical protein RIR48_2454 [Bacteroidota bacterium]
MGENDAPQSPFFELAFFGHFFWQCKKVTAVRTGLCKIKVQMFYYRYIQNPSTYVAKNNIIKY